MTSLCEKVRTWRTETMKLTLSEAGVLLDLSPRYLSEIETGKKDFSKQVIKSYLRVAPDFFTANDFYC